MPHLSKNLSKITLFLRNSERTLVIKERRDSPKEVWWYWEMSTSNSWQRRTNCPALWCLTHFQVTASPLARGISKPDENCIMIWTQRFFNTFEQVISIFSFCQESIFLNTILDSAFCQYFIYIELWTNSIKIST